MDSPSILDSHGINATYRKSVSRSSMHMQAAPKKGAATTPAQEDNVVTINIGRIDVRAVVPRQAQSPPTNKQPATISLADYLKMRAEGRI
jgi:hypothetical protein